MTGGQLEQAFGLLSTWASFTTISTAPGRAARARRRVPRRRHQPVSAQARAVMALVPLVDELVGAVAGLHGNVYPAPAPAHSKIAVQLRTRHGWRTVLHARVGAGGAYDAALPGPGTYRVVYGGLSGPSVDGPVRPLEMPGPLLAIDGPFLLYRSFFALPDSIKGVEGIRSTRCSARPT